MTTEQKSAIDAAVVVLLLPLIYHSFRKSLTNLGVLMTLYRATVCKYVTLLKAKMGQKYVTM